MKTLTTVSILGVRVSDVCKTQLLMLVLEWADQANLHILNYVNAHCLNMAWTDTKYREILNRSDLTFPDGISVVWAGKWLYGARLTKLNGRVWLPDICQIAVTRQWRIYILAGKRGVASTAAKVLNCQYPGLNIVGATDGFFQERTEVEVLREIATLQPHILFVGMGTPLQEKWIAAHQDANRIPIVWAVGSLFDTVTGIESPAPLWFNTLALEWLWRLLINPRKKWRRYIIGNPVYLFRVLRQKFFQK